MRRAEAAPPSVPIWLIRQIGIRVLPHLRCVRVFIEVRLYGSFGSRLCGSWLEAGTTRRPAFPANYSIAAKVPTIYTNPVATPPSRFRDCDCALPMRLSLSHSVPSTIWPCADQEPSNRRRCGALKATQSEAAEKRPPIGCPENVRLRPEMRPISNAPIVQRQTLGACAGSMPSLSHRVAGRRFAGGELPARRPGAQQVGRGVERFRLRRGPMSG